MENGQSITMTEKVEMMEKQIERYIGFHGMKTAVTGARVIGDDLELKVTLFDSADEIHVALKEDESDVRD